MAKKQSFAERMMEKSGWKEGKGLGKDETGIVDPIKASMKFDQHGVGHDIAKEFTNHWWDLAFKKASNSIHVEKSSVKLYTRLLVLLEIFIRILSFQENGEVEVKSKKSKKKKKSEKREQKKQLYSAFVKSATLTNGKVVEEEKPEEDEEEIKGPARLLSEDELFKALEGVTAHKYNFRYC